MPWFHHEAPVISRPEIEAMCQRLLDEARDRLGSAFRRVLLLPPDLTRAHSGAVWISETLYRLLPASCDTRHQHWTCGPARGAGIFQPQ